MNETIFFPLRTNGTGDPREQEGDSVVAHSFVQLDGERFCLGRLPGCPYCGEWVPVPYAEGWTLDL